MKMLTITDKQIEQLKSSGTVEIAPVDGVIFSEIQYVAGSDGNQLGVWVWPLFPMSETDNTVVAWLIERYEQRI